MAFNSKNLHYEKNEPAFLRKLRDEHGGDRNNVQFTRPKKDRLNTGDDDDGPTIVDEQGGSVSKEEYETLVKNETFGVPTEKNDEKAVIGNLTAEKEKEVSTSVDDGERAKQKVAEIGAPKKRKQAKVVGDEVEDVDIVKVASIQQIRDEHYAPKATKKPKKKVKLSFDEPD